MSLSIDVIYYTKYELFGIPQRKQEKFYNDILTLAKVELKAYYTSPSSGILSDGWDNDSDPL